MWSFTGALTVAVPPTAAACRPKPFLVSSSLPKQTKKLHLSPQSLSLPSHFSSSFKTSATSVEQQSDNKVPLFFLSPSLLLLTNQTNPVTFLDDCRERKLSTTFWLQTPSSCLTKRNTSRSNCLNVSVTTVSVKRSKTSGLWLSPSSLPISPNSLKDFVVLLLLLFPPMAPGSR